MKYFNAKLMKPDISQFYEVVNNKLSEAAPKSIAQLPRQQQKKRLPEAV